MPLAELVRYLNHQNRERYGGNVCSGDGLTISPSGIQGQDEDLVLRSVFQPISALRGGRIIGHEALLRAESANGEALTAADVFGRARSPEKLIYLDRLCRTLHALNYLQLARNGDGTLFLNIEPRHVQAVGGGHGLVFEAVLKRCGLSPDHIVFELRAGELTENPHLLEALAAYRSRGYRIAIDQATPVLDHALVSALRPSLVKFDVRSLQRGRSAGSAATGDSAARAIVAACREAGAEIAATHVSTIHHLPYVRTFSADYLQGHYLAPPSPHLGGENAPEISLAPDDATLAAIRG